MCEWPAVRAPCMWLDRATLTQCHLENVSNYSACAALSWWGNQSHKYLGHMDNSITLMLHALIESSPGSRAHSSPCQAVRGHSWLGRYILGHPTPLEAHPSLIGVICVVCVQGVLALQVWTRYLYGGRCWCKGSLNKHHCQPGPVPHSLTHH